MQDSGSKTICRTGAKHGTECPQAGTASGRAWAIQEGPVTSSWFGGGQGLGLQNVKMAHFPITNQWKNTVLEDVAEDCLFGDPREPGRRGPKPAISKSFLTERRQPRILGRWSQLQHGGPVARTRIPGGLTFRGGVRKMFSTSWKLKWPGSVDSRRPR